MQLRHVLKLGLVVGWLFSSDFCARADFQGDGDLLNSGEAVELLNCREMSAPLLDTGVGYLVAIPEHFEVRSSNPIKMDSFGPPDRVPGSSTPRTNINIWLESPGETDIQSWEDVDTDHPNAEGLVIRFVSVPATDETRDYYYALSNSRNTLLIFSRRPINIGTLLDCFVPQANMR